MIKPRRIVQNNIYLHEYTMTKKLSCFLLLCLLLQRKMGLRNRNQQLRRANWVRSCKLKVAEPDNCRTPTQMSPEAYCHWRCCPLLWFGAKKKKIFFCRFISKISSLDSISSARITSERESGRVGHGVQVAQAISYITGPQCPPFSIFREERRRERENRWWSDAIASLFFRLNIDGPRYLLRLRHKKGGGGP